jgi:hypothetical protein
MLPEVASTKAAGMSEQALLLEARWTTVFVTGPGDLELIDAGSGRLVVIAPVTPATGADVSARSRETIGAGLRLVQGLLDRAELAGSRLVLVTRRAVPVGGDDDVDVTAALLWSLVRTVQAEHPGRIVLLDTDTGPDREIDGPLLSRAATAGEPELVIRAGELFAPRPAGRRAPHPQPRGRAFRTRS